MRHTEKDASQVLRELRADHSEGDYLELVWLQRYPKAPTRSSPGWPYRRAGEMPHQMIRVVR